jgi:hypothetical protein
MSNFNLSIDTNPLLKDFPLEIGRGDWWQRLASDPFHGEDLQAMSEFRRDLLLEEFHKIYAPTQTAAEIAYSIHRMIVGGWIDRHPHSEAQKQLVYQIAAAGDDGRRTLGCLCTRPRGMILSGITKQGKTTLIKRVLSQYPQVIHRGPDEKAGWLALSQLVYLVIPMPTDSSKSGFLMQAFIELDKALGTRYAEETVIRTGTIDVQLVQLLAKLALHRCGVLVIEEAQESNGLSVQKFGVGFQTFFLRVLNTGIPTILIGNPLAFTDLKASSQLMSRLSDPGDWELQPSASADAPEWVRDLVPTLWGKTVLPEPDDPIENRNEFLWTHTGGFAHFLSVFRRETLRVAVAANARRVMLEHVQAALRSKTMTAGRSIIKSYRNSCAGLDVDYSDMPGTLNPAVFQVRPASRLARKGSK